METQDQETQAVENKKDFEAPRHWVGSEELSENYWNDEAIQKQRGQEFVERPLEWAEKLEGMDQWGMARRDFLTLMGASMALAGVSCARRPVNKIIPYVVKPEEVTPGVANFYASTSHWSGRGLLVKTREGRPIKLEGNPDHPMNQGAISARDQASLLDLYDPARLKYPVSGVRKGGETKTTWSAADQAIGAKLKKIAAGRGRVRILSGAIHGDSTHQLVKDFLGAFSAGSHVEYDPLSPDHLIDAQEASYGKPAFPRYRFDRADVIVSFGADFLGEFGDEPSQAKGFAARRKLSGKKSKNAKMSRFWTFESRMSLTGSNADERVQVRAGDEYKIALAMAHDMIVRQKRSRYSVDSSVTGVLSRYSVDRVAKETGISAELIRKASDELWQSRGQSIVLGGGLSAQSRAGYSLELAVNLLNSALENEGKTVDGVDHPRAHLGSRFTEVQKLVSDMRSGKVDALVVVHSNPAYTLPASLKFAEASQKVPLVVTLDDRITETGMLSDYVLPTHHFLENWGDGHVMKNVHSIGQPAISPLHETRAEQDNLIAWTRAGDLKAKGLTQSKTWYDALRAYWRTNHYPKSGKATFQGFWEDTLRKGVFIRGSLKTANASARRFNTSSLKQIKASTANEADQITLVYYSKGSMGDGRQANNAWLQEMPDSITTATWDNYVNVSPALAKKLKLKTYDVVKVSVETGEGLQTFELPTNVLPGMAENTISVAVGYGRTSVGKVGNKVGQNVFGLTEVNDGRVSFGGFPAKLEKTGKFYRIALTQWHHVTENRPIINDVSLKDYRKKASAENHTNPHLRMAPWTMWEKHKYKGHRWGMSIDLSSCTGCGSCVIACQAENNIPVVGRDNVRVGREMHWIRIDRYFSGDENNPDVVYQPMLCQHCENASCETVCPVLATVHSDEGLNDQVYNRCVGTRYCQNNCPYKVRRFNFFDHWKHYKGTMNMVWNPEVTVRSRGIMEKCSFCVQRIRDAKDHAKDQGRKVRDGEVVTACQQTCPTDAIAFGDVNDKKTEVAKLHVDPRSFRVLEILNNVPMIAYQSKVRNKDKVKSHGGH